MITVITPVYNAAEHIRFTLESISKQKASFEHIVMDAVSSDATVKIAKEYEKRYNLRVVSRPDEGLYDAVQRGFDEGSGDILAWINAGDIYMPWTLSVVEKVFKLHPEIDWITGVTSWFYEKSNLFRLEVTVPAYSRMAIRRGWHNGRWLPPIQQESTFWRRRLWDQSQGAVLLRGQGRGKGYACDYHLWRRFAEHARLRTVCTVLAAFTVTPGQITEKYRIEYAKETGLSRHYECPNVVSRCLYRLYSFCKVALGSKALSGGGVSEELPLRII